MAPLTVRGSLSSPGTMFRKKQFQLIGITDTAMLRPQVFALQKGEVEIGLICSEKQAIDATLESLAKEDPRFGTVADHYWNARGGSYTDGGGFHLYRQRISHQERWLSPARINSDGLSMFPRTRHPLDARVRAVPVSNLRCRPHSGYREGVFPETP